MKKIFYSFALLIFLSNLITAQTTIDTIDVAAGWNLIGSLSTGEIQSIISTEPPGIITASIFGYIPGGGYYQADSLKRGNGYWVKVSQAGEIIFTITTVQSPSDTLNVSTGWNLIGSLSTGEIQSIISTEPPGIITASIFGYIPGGGYYQADSLKRGNGYWVRVNQNGIIIINIDLTPQPPTLSLPENGITNISLLPTLVWNTSSGATSYTLQVSTNDQFTNLVYNQSGLTGTSQEINALINLTTYYWRVSATNSYGTSGWSDVWSFTTTATLGVPCPGIPTVTYAGKTYNTVQIGQQCWLRENLDVGTRIDANTNQTSGSGIEKYCYYDDATYCSIYGGLYQWDEAMQYDTTTASQGICPTGWHIPSIADFNVLGLVGDGNALKEVGQGTGGGAGTNTTGFSALLAGFAGPGNTPPWKVLGEYGFFWSSCQSHWSEARAYFLDYFDDGFWHNEYGKIAGFSVRCIKN